MGRDYPAEEKGNPYESFSHPVAFRCYLQIFRPARTRCPAALIALSGYSLKKTLLNPLHAACLPLFRPAPSKLLPF